MPKEFETQIQEIIQEIKELILIPMHPCTDVESELIERERLISERIKQLQPPKPPTCGTCDHMEVVYGINGCGQKVKRYRNCKKIKHLKQSEAFGEFHHDVEIPLSGWGCNRHSDYKVTK